MTFDTNSDYWRIKIDKSDQDKTSFTSPLGLYRFIRRPFGLMHVPSTSQRTMEASTSTIKRQFDLEHLGDILLYSKLDSNHPFYFCSVLGLLSGAGMWLKLKK